MIGLGRRAAELAAPPAEYAAAAVAEAREEISRTDAKAGVLLTVATGALAGLVTFAHAGHVQLAAAGLSGCAVVVLLSVVRPRLPGAARVFPDHEALLSPGCDVAAWQRARLGLFSRLALAKHRRVRVAVDLLFAGLAVLAAAVVAGAA